MERKKYFIVFILSALCHIGLAQSLDKAKLDLYFETLASNNKFMGNVAVSKDGQVIYTKSVGFADIEKGIKSDEKTKYRIGSISKTFTTVLVLKAVEEKKLNLNQQINKYFPTIPNADKITIKNLLNHRSGIHNFTDDSDYLTWNTTAKTEKEMIEIIRKAGSDFEPGTKAAYSNSNFVLLSYILEKVYGMPYAEVLQKKIIQPLGLKDTKLGGKISSANNECSSYLWDGSWKKSSETDMSIPMGAGGIISTPTDLVQFSDALFGGKLMSASSVEIMKTMEDNFGAGLFKFPFYDKASYGHTGGIDEFRSIFSYFPDGNYSYALTTNGINYDMNLISLGVLSAMYDKPYSIPTFSNYAVSQEDLASYVGEYSSAQLPLKITIRIQNNALFAQATGQSAFPLEAVDKHKFKFDRAGIQMEFNPVENKMVLKQGGGQFVFTK